MTFVPLLKATAVFVSQYEHPRKQDAVSKDRVA